MLNRDTDPSRLEPAPLGDDTRAPGLSALVARLEKRLEQSRTPGRDVEALLGELLETLHAEWPSNPTRAAELAVRIAVASFSWFERTAEHPRGLRALPEVAVERLNAALTAAPALEADFAPELLAAWRHAPADLRDLLGRIIAARSSPAVLGRLEATLMADIAHQQVAPPAAPGVMPGARAVANPGWWRDHTVLLARVRAARGDIDGALRGLEREPSSDPRVLETAADILVGAGREDEGMERLKRAAVVATDPQRLRERLCDRLLEKGEFTAAIEQLGALLEESGDLTYWATLRAVAAAHAPQQIATTLARLQDRSPGLHIEVLMAEGDTAAVAAASSGKTFSYDLLWKLGDYLTNVEPASAARVYERAMLLQGATAQSRAQCTDLADRILRTQPVLESIGRGTLLRRAAREILARQKNNIPLKRELERVFATTF